MLKSMHSLIFSKLRIATKTNVSILAAREAELRAAVETRCLRLEEELNALKKRCVDLERSQQEKLVTLKTLGTNLESVQQLGTSIESVQQEKNTILNAEYSDLKQRYLAIESIQESLSIAIGLNCKRTTLLSQKENIEQQAPYLQSPLAFEQQLKKLQELEPNAFDLWWQCFLNGEQEYARSVEGNLSYGVHPGASAFHTFVSPFLDGNVLDIGCGPQLLPTYLHSAIKRENTHLFGIDPLYAEHPFEFYRGFSEFLPWQEDCFDAVICGTSLDHCLSLSRTLEEIKRVLKPGGKLLVWVGFIPGAKIYDPKSPELCALDKYHLFHFDSPWFESLMADYFKFIAMVNHDSASSFYVFEG